MTPKPDLVSSPTRISTSERVVPQRVVTVRGWAKDMTATIKLSVTVWGLRARIRRAEGTSSKSDKCNGMGGVNGFVQSCKEMSSVSFVMNEVVPSPVFSMLKLPI